MGRNTPRRGRTLSILLVMVASLLVIPAATAQEDAVRDNADINVQSDAEPTEILVRDSSLLRPQSVGAGDWVVVEPQPGESVSQAHDRLSRVLGADNVVYNLTYHLHGDPNDPLFGFQWNFGATDVVAAWDYTKGAGVTVARRDREPVVAEGLLHRPSEAAVSTRWCRHSGFGQPIEAPSPRIPSRAEWQSR